jgi:tetratricopeptide (TPR) repeat protein
MLLTLFGNVGRSVSPYKSAQKLSETREYCPDTRRSGKSAGFYNRALEMIPTLKEALLNRGNYFFNQGDFSNALADFNQTIQCILIRQRYTSSELRLIYRFLMLHQHKRI